MKIDLAYPDEHKMGRFPYNVQAKSYSKSILYPKLLSEIEQDPEEINVIMHKQTQRSGDRFMTRGKFAILSTDDFFKLVAYRKGYETLIQYFDSLPEDVKKEADKELKQFKL